MKAKTQQEYYARLIGLITLCYKSKSLTFHQKLAINELLPPGDGTFDELVDWDLYHWCPEIHSEMIAGGLLDSRECEFCNRLVKMKLLGQPGKLKDLGIHKTGRIDCEGHEKVYGCWRCDVCGNEQAEEL